MNTEIRDQQREPCVGDGRKRPRSASQNHEPCTRRWSSERLEQLNRSLRYAHELRPGDVVAVRSDHDPYGFWVAEVQVPRRQTFTAAQVTHTFGVAGPCLKVHDGEDLSLKFNDGEDRPSQRSPPPLPISLTCAYVSRGKYVVDLRWYDRFRSQLFTRLTGRRDVESVNVECLVVLPSGVRLQFESTPGREHAVRGSVKLSHASVRVILTAGERAATDGERAAARLPA